MKMFTSASLIILLLLVGQRIVEVEAQTRVLLTHVDKGLPLSEKLNRGAERSEKRNEYWQARHNGQSRTRLTQSPAEPEYLMELDVGTPPKRFKGIMDTGSELIWLKCGSCSQCSQNEQGCTPCSQNVLYPWQSASFSTISCNPYYPSSCGPLPEATCTSHTNPYRRALPTSSCSFMYAYDGMDYTRGEYATEALSLGPSQTSNIAFGCAHMLASANGFGGADGIVGLNPEPLSLVSQLPIDGTFSYCLSHYGQDADSAFFFGPLPPHPLAGSTPLLGKTNYFVRLQNISVGNELISRHNDPYSDLNGPAGTIFDSGTTFTLLEESVFNAVKHAFLNQMPYLPQVHIPNRDDLCFDVSHAPNVEVPPLTFHLEGASFTPPRDNYMGMLAPNTMCLLIQPATRKEGYVGTVGIIGNMMQQNHLITYDTKAKRLSFVPADCSNM